MTLVEIDSPSVRSFEANESKDWELLYPSVEFLVDADGTIIADQDGQTLAFGSSAVEKVEQMWSAFPMKDWPAVGLCVNPRAVRISRDFGARLRAEGFRLTSCRTQGRPDNVDVTYLMRNQYTPSALSSRVAVVQLSNLNIIEEPAPGGGQIVRVMAFGSESAVPGASVELWSSDLHLVFVGRSGQDGTLKFDKSTSSSGHAAWVVVRSGEDAVVVPFRDDYRSDYDVPEDAFRLSWSGWLPGESVFGRWAPVSAQKLPRPYWLPPITVLPFIEPPQEEPRALPVK